MLLKKTEYNELVKNVNDISTTDNSNLVKKTDCNTKINEIENKVNYHDHDKYITTHEFNKLTLGNFAARLKQEKVASKNAIADFVKKTDFDNKLINFNKKNKLK